MFKEIASKFLEIKPKLENLLNPNSIYANSKNYINETKEKIVDLEKTNLELAIFHLYKGNISDAIFRFKLIKSFSKNYNSKILFYLGICYFAKRKEKSAEEYFHDYLKSKDASYIDSTKFYLKIIHGDSRSVKSIPNFFVNLKSNHFFYVKQKSYSLYNEKIEDKMNEYLEERHQFFNTRIIDIGCSAAPILNNFIKIHNCKFNLGVANKNVIELDQFIAAQSKTYHKILKKKPAALHLLDLDLKVKFHIVFALEVFRYQSDLKVFMPKILDFLEDFGLLVISLKTSDNVTKFSFDKGSEEFIYNMQYLEECLALNKLKIFHTKQIKDKKNSCFDNIIFISRKNSEK